MHLKIFLEKKRRATEAVARDGSRAAEGPTAGEGNRMLCRPQTSEFFLVLPHGYFLCLAKKLKNKNKIK